MEPPQSAEQEATPPAEKENLKSIIKTLLDSPEFVRHLAKDKILRRPPNNSKLSNLSYFRETFALEAKVVIDAMMEDKKDREWRYSKYPELKKNSLYQRVYQSIRFLLLHLDPDGKYAAARECLHLGKTETGIRLSWIRDKMLGRAFVPDVVSDEEITSSWMEQITKFLEDDSGVKVLHLKNLSLTKEQQRTITESLLTLEGIDHVATETEIKIIKSYLHSSDQEPS